MCGFCMAVLILLVLLAIGAMSVSFYFQLEEQQELNAKNCSLLDQDVQGVPDPVEWAYTNAGCARSLRPLPLPRSLLAALPSCLHLEGTPGGVRGLPQRLDSRSCEVVRWGRSTHTRKEGFAAQSKHAG